MIYLQSRLLNSWNKPACDVVSLKNTFYRTLYFQNQMWLFRIILEFKM